MFWIAFNLLLLHYLAAFVTSVNFVSLMVLSLICS